MVDAVSQDQSKTTIPLMIARATHDTAPLAVAFSALKEALGSSDPAVAIVASAAIVAMMRSAENV